MNSNTELSNELADMAKSMREIDGDDAKGIKDGIEAVEDIASESDNPHVRFQSYMLSTLVDDIWHNIAMTSSVYIHDDILIELIQSLGEYIKDISIAYEENDYNKVYQELAYLYEEYDDRMKVIDEDMQRGVGKPAVANGGNQ